MGTGAAKITNKEYPRAGTQIFFEKIACAETAEPRMTVPYTTVVDEAFIVTNLNGVIYCFAMVIYHGIGVRESSCDAVQPPCLC